MDTRKIEIHTANILIKMEGEGHWAAKKEKINGVETIVFFRRKKISSPLQALRDKSKKIMSGTAAANRYLKKMQINQNYKILGDLQDPNKKKISQESLNSYIQNLHSITKINENLSSSIENISKTEKWKDNVVSVCEIISFEGSEDSVKALKLINSLVENRTRSDFDSTDKPKTLSAFKARPLDIITKNTSETLISSHEQKEITKYINFALDNSYQNKSIKEQNEHKEKCKEAYRFLQKIKLPESSVAREDLAKLINKLKIIENTKPSKNPTVLKMKLEIASSFLEELSNDLKIDEKHLQENRIEEIIKHIDIAIDPNAYKSKDKKNKEFEKLSQDARIDLILLTRSFDQPSRALKNIFKIIGNLDSFIPGIKSNTVAAEIKELIKPLTNFLQYQLDDEIDEERIKQINSSLETAFYNFYDIETKGNSHESVKDTLQKLGDANQTLGYLRELVRLDASTNVIAQETVATLDKLIEALNNKIDNLLRER